ncbi:hypothetical protein [Sphingomonas mollis]|uniref:hypothetical protein n=1 Tax=Sphingomonas mollis TaxID=2795726 RepID=UPI0018EBEC13|nr:hypothetical protein [Sphingomonas sp. BT553]
MMDQSRWVASGSWRTAIAISISDEKDSTTRSHYRVRRVTLRLGYQTPMTVRHRPEEMHAILMKFVTPSASIRAVSMQPVRHS